MSSRKLRRVGEIRPEIVERLARHRIVTCKDVLQKNHLELLKFTGASYKEVLEIQVAVGKAIVPKVQTVSSLCELGN